MTNVQDTKEMSREKMGHHHRKEEVTPLKLGRATGQAGGQGLYCLAVRGFLGVGGI